MKDKEIIMDVLENEKTMSANMVYALNEASHEKLYNELFNMFQQINESAKDVFAICYNLGYYTLEAEKATKLQKSIQKLQQELDCFNEQKEES